MAYNVNCIKITPPSKPDKLVTWLGNRLKYPSWSSQLARAVLHISDWKDVKRSSFILFSCLKLNLRPLNRPRYLHQVLFLHWNIDLDFEVDFNWCHWAKLRPKPVSDGIYHAYRTYCQRADTRVWYEHAIFKESSTNYSSVVLEPNKWRSLYSLFFFPPSNLGIPPSQGKYEKILIILGLAWLFKTTNKIKQN